MIQTDSSFSFDTHSPLIAVMMLLFSWCTRDDFDEENSIRPIALTSTVLVNLVRRQIAKWNEFFVEFKPNCAQQCTYL